MTSAAHITKAATSIFGPFLDEKGRQGIVDYKYTGQDCSLLAPAMYKFWNLFFKLVPPRMSPNVVTVIGISILGLATLWANLSDADDSFKCFVLVVAINLYQTADAVDGLQGKRVGMYQNATTEMFDHGVDSMANVLTLSSMIQFILGIKHPLLATMVLYSSLTAFHAPTYEHLITGKMIFRGGPTNPTEGLVLAQLFFLVAGVFPSFFHGFWGHALAMGGVLVSALSLLSSVQSLYVFYKNDFGKTIHSALRGYMPLFFAIFTSFLWLPWDTKLYNAHPALCIFAIALPWNYSIFRTILNEITGVKNLDTMSILKGQSAALIPGVAHLLGLPLFWPCMISLFLNASIYIYTIIVSLREACDALGMASWYSIRDERTINKKPK